MVEVPAHPLKVLKYRFTARYSVIGSQLLFRNDKRLLRLTP